MKTINIKAEIPKNHKLVIDIPEDLPVGPADIVLVIVPESETISLREKTAGDMLESPLFGVWKDRQDIDDSVEFAEELRKKAEMRKSG